MSRLRLTALFSTVLCSTILPCAVGAQTVERAVDPVEETWSAACSSKIEKPAYPDWAVQLKLGGSVSVDLVVDAGGKATALKLGGPAPFAEVVGAAIGATIFPTACNGRQLKATFTFGIAPDLSPDYHVSVCFSHPPNTFSVLADRNQMVCPHYSYMTALVESGGMKPITVCELLADPAAYDGKPVALLGKWADSHFDGVWLVEDNCGSKLVSGDHAWPNEVWIADGSSGPMPPVGLVVLDPDALDEKLESLRRTTSLKIEEETFFHKDGAVTHELVQQRWAVVFGRIEARRELRPPRGRPGDRDRDWGNGFGQMNAAPVQIVCSQQNEFFIQETASRR